MNDTLFEQLVYEEEGPTLDFKRDQYRFAKASDEQRSELLKDILGFANAWRRSEAFILIGLEDVRGGRANVVGVAEHLDDHSLQQFVNSLINRPMRFHYEAFGFEGKQVGVIRIEQQLRPVYLKRDFGRLKKNEVYVRRGTSTDPTSPATPEEIALMGAAGRSETAELTVAFADIERDTSLGTTVSWQVEYCEMPAEKQIPELSDQRTSAAYPWAGVAAAFNEYTVNGNYYRELARYEFARRLFRPARLIVTNGPVAATSVRLELIIPTTDDVRVLYHSDLPEPPQRSYNRFDVVRAARILPVFRDGGVHLDRNSDRIRIEIDCGDIQPGRQVWSEPFLLGITKDGEMCIAGRVFAANLPKPRDFSLTVAASVARSQFTVEQLKLVGRPRTGDR